MISEDLEASSKMSLAQDKIASPNQIHMIDMVSEDNYPGVEASHGPVWTLDGNSFNISIMAQSFDVHGYVASSRRTDNCI